MKILAIVLAATSMLTFAAEAGSTRCTQSGNTMRCYDSDGTTTRCTKSGNTVRCYSN